MPLVFKPKYTYTQEYLTQLLSQERIDKYHRVSHSTSEEDIGHNLDQVYFVHPSTDMLVDMWTDTQLIYRSRCVSQHVDWHINQDIGRYLVWHLTNMSVDMWTDSHCPTIGRHVDPQATDIPPIPHCCLRTGDCSFSRRYNLTLVSDFCWVAQISLIYPLLLRGLSLSSYLDSLNFRLIL